MKIIALVLMLTPLMSPLAVAQTATQVHADLLASDDKLPALLGHFSAESTISDRGRLYIWSYNASLAVHETPYFGKVPSLIVAVRDPALTTVHHLNFLTGEVVVVLSPAPAGDDDATKHIRPSDSAYSEALVTMKDILQTMISLDGRNAPLAEAVNYLAQKIAEHQAASLN